MTETKAHDDAAKVVLRNVAELAQRQQARELGSSLARQIFRLLKVVQFHALDNMAVLQQVDQTVQALKVFGAQTGEPLSLLFARSAVFVNGQLLKASRADYDAALEVSAMVRRAGVSQLTLQTDAERADLTALARLFQPPHTTRAERGVLEPSPRVRLRWVSAARLDENEQKMSPEDQILRTYATTVVVMRRVYENLMAARYQLPNQAKRLAQKLVQLSEGDTPAFLGVTAMRNLNHDAAGRAVNRSILAVSMGRQLTGDLATLSRIAMSALFLDVAIPLVTGAAGQGHDAVVPKLNPHSERRLPAATAAVLTALGQLRDASMVRTVIGYEAQCLRRLALVGPPYDGAFKPMVAARIVATANRFNELMDPDLAASRAPTVDDALAKLRSEARDAVDHAMLVLLIGALGVFPRGTPVELSTGERAVVVRTPDNPADYSRPVVRLVHDASGQPLKMKVTLDLASDPDRQVVGVIRAPDAALVAAARAVEAAALPPSEEPSVPPPPASRQRLESALGFTDPPRAAAPPPEAPQQPVEPQRRLSSVQGVAAPAGVRARPAAALVEVVESAPSRRDPRSDDYEPGDQARSARPPSSRQPLVPTVHNRPTPVATPAVDPEAVRQPAEPRAAEPEGPSARGSLVLSPLSSVLIDILDRGLTGSLVLTEPGADGEAPREHAVYFQDGVPSKVSTAVRVAALGPLLVAWGILEQTQLESELLTQPPTHEARLELELLDSGLARAEQLAEVRNEQLAERLCWLFGLPGATRYEFHEGRDLLEATWGRIAGVTSPLAILTRGLREHPEEDAMDQLLAQLGESPLALHEESDVTVFDFSEAELAVASAFEGATPSVPELMASGHAPDVVRRVVYLLTLARCLAPVES